jgi:hypothetical protein
MPDPAVPPPYNLDPIDDPLADGYAMPAAQMPTPPPRCGECGRNYGWIAQSGHAAGCTTGEVEVEGEKCQACGQTYATVYWLPDDVWACITPVPLQAEGAGLLCPPCADKRARAAGIELFWGAGVGEYPRG